VRFETLVEGMTAVKRRMLMPMVQLPSVLKHVLRGT